ncbi:hypothetical protein niasHT_000675 [Heterodera trifolii]|uniref:14-3-3 domain-containing protein n=1 Tax=Heterodera trifolii TaxID=157864 RepID=A0ABD2MCK9_9BILA
MTDEPETKDQLIYLINVCEKARRFDDMVEAMKKLIKLEPNLGLEDRVSLAVAYKGAMSLRRSSWRSLVSIEERTGPEMNERQHQVMQSYREHVQNELVTICQELLTCINEVLFPKATDPEPKVFYLKMKADYYRYMAEVAKCHGDDSYNQKMPRPRPYKNTMFLVVRVVVMAFFGCTSRRRGIFWLYESSSWRFLDVRVVVVALRSILCIKCVVELAKAAYQEAMEIATSKIAATNPTRLGLALNFSVFIFEILKSVDEARKVAQKAIDLAQAEIATLTVPLADDASINLRMMRENMELWTPEGGSHTKTT